ncbi:uncharacterized protein BT62DRAFT_245354 [Guyanagaster necrorhizus]|uniref:N-acetyltransferase domain-containing protein n=1 Tax=Guyanagaster necrorhizus TaxID=856835 RepID=A0A9P8AS36_9AGAR|nr:uncharacterized protein BT62DRAFT_245354 [Guyanagaster necrorhizus MCA 3950]KAG7444472.1 hypothetical protein BT62DRAFT_245354 [Guyanagaster necrorhizus MCA 3950]
MSPSDESYDSDETFKPAKQRQRTSTMAKRRKLSRKQHPSDPESANEPNTQLDSFFREIACSDSPGRAFEDVFEALVPDYAEVRNNLHRKEGGKDEYGVQLRTLTRFESSCVLDSFSQGDVPYATYFLLRKLKLDREQRRVNFSPADPRLIESITGDTLPSVQEQQDLPNSKVLEALQDIQTTAYEVSFASRLQGTMPSRTPGLLALDWETVTPWMALMNDVRQHYRLAHPGQNHVAETSAPIEYCSLRACHLGQVHELLAGAFWEGIDVSDSLDYWPERCTVVATYKRLVVGIAIISSPRETYITFLAVKPGWDNAQIATSMLYHLIQLNPHKDITLHVSANNPALLLYNRFGFKAEGFVVGFYEAYLDPQSRSSTNAFRLRLRH